MDAAQAGEAGAGQQPHEDRLCLVVFLMSGGDITRADFRGDGGELFVANVARRGFDSRRPNDLGVERPIRNVDFDSEPPAEIADEGLVAIGVLAAKMMVDVPRRHLEPLRPQFGKKEEQRGRINPA